MRVSAKISEDVIKGNLDLADILECDAFSGIDEIIIKWALEQLGDELVDSKIGKYTIDQIADIRIGKACHFEINQR